ncbi:MAG TPA: CAP domain-containing protein [Chloroflexota bacterium]|nr:CAP domain-containing protein [Chloroflexota bacterium]
MAPPGAIGEASGPLAQLAPVAESAQGSPAAEAPALGALEDQLFELVNADRLVAGLAPLAYDQALQQVARARAAAQVPLAQLSHFEPSGRPGYVVLVEELRLAYALVGENLARLPGPEETVAERAEEGLRRSPTHRENTLDPVYDRLAVGAATASDGRFVFAVIFGSAAHG